MGSAYSQRGVGAGARGKRPLRADAARNREAVLRAARAEFAEAGLGARVERIAERAGVGVGTVYRAFPNKEALVEALAMDRLGALAAEAAEALRRVEEEGAGAWEALEGFMERAAAMQAEDDAFARVVSARIDALEETSAAKAGLRAAMSGLATRAEADGVLRAGVGADDLHALLCGLEQAGSVGRNHGLSGEAWRRYLRIVLDGLKAPTAADREHRWGCPFDAAPDLPDGF